MYTPVNPNFTILQWGVRECSLHGHVIMKWCNMLQKSKDCHKEVFYYTSAGGTSEEALKS